VAISGRAPWPWQLLLRDFGGAVVSSEYQAQRDTRDLVDGRLKASSLASTACCAEIFLTNCKKAARTSSAVTGGSKLKSVLIFRHIVLITP
jgi:hypothetical protein